MGFLEFARRKEQEAAAARLVPYVTVVERPDPALSAIGNEWTRQLFDGDFYLYPAPAGDRPACSLVFVQSSDGNTGARDPSTLGGGETDKHLIYEGLSRVAADAVLAGAETIRGGKIVLSVWHPELVRLRATLDKPRHPIQIVVTAHGFDLEREMLFNVPEIRVVLLTVSSCRSLFGNALAERPWITPIVMDHGRQLDWAFTQLRRLGIERLSCIGGRRLATQLIDASLVQDTYLTTAAKSGGEPETPMYAGKLEATAIVRKAGTGPDVGVRFEHLLL